MISTIFFDLDNTLIDRDAAYRRYVLNLMSRLTRELTAPETKHIISEIMDHDDSGRCNRTKHCRWLATQLAPLIQYDWSPNDFWNDQCAHLAEFVEPDRELLQLLGVLQEDYRLAVISNGSSDNQRRKLAAARLTEHFDPIIISGEYGVAKPVPSIFKAALDAASVSATEAVMIGDDFVNDIGGALQVSMHAIWLCDRKNAESGIQLTPNGADCVPVCSRLNDLPEILARMK